MLTVTGVARAVQKGGGRCDVACGEPSNPIIPLPMKRLFIFLYGLAAYAAFLATCLYAAGFIGDFLVPKSLDSPATVPVWQALLVNLGLLSLFAVQHSVMARPAFKRWWTRYVPEAAERSTYVLLSSVALAILFAFWQPMGGTIWHVENGVGRVLFHTLFAAGWVLVLTSTYLINHFDLFGLRQAWLHLRGEEYTPLKFATPALYRVVRHPLYVGWITVFWAAPTMTVAHLVFALATTVYILLAVRLEERDLVAHHPEYADYQRRVPMLIPRRQQVKHVAAVTLFILCIGASVVLVKAYARQSAAGQIETPALSAL
jgi:protein-S-isoprenylcysteine O-methyltransferase Ste14